MKIKIVSFSSTIHDLYHVNQMMKPIVIKTLLSQGISQLVLQGKGSRDQNETKTILLLLLMLGHYAPWHYEFDRS